MHHGCTNITATCLDTETELLAKHPQATPYIERLKTEGQNILYGVDATKMTPRSLGGRRRKRRKMTEGKKIKQTKIEKEEGSDDDDENDSDDGGESSGDCYGTEDDDDDDDERGGTTHQIRQGKEDHDDGWDWIVFNFPHVGGKSTDVNRQVRYNQGTYVIYLSCSYVFASPDLFDSAPFSFSSSPPLFHHHHHHYGTANLESLIPCGPARFSSR